MPNITFSEPGTDQSGAFSFNTTGTLQWKSLYGAVTGAVASDQTLSYTGPRSLKISSGNPAVNARVDTLTGVLSDSGRRITFWFRFDVLPSADCVFLGSLPISGITTIHSLKLNSSGQILNVPEGATTVTGSATLSVNTWYRIALSYTITNTTTFRFDCYVNGVSDSSATAGTMTTINTSKCYFRNGATGGVDRIHWFDDIYIDDGSDYTDPGNIRIYTTANGMDYYRRLEPSPFMVGKASNTSMNIFRRLEPSKSLIYFRQRSHTS